MKEWKKRIMELLEGTRTEEQLYIIWRFIKNIL